MFDRSTDYPTAVASYDDEGIAAAIAWCIQHMSVGDTLSVWTFQKANLRNCDVLDRLVRRNSNVDHITRRGGGAPRSSGPVLMAWPDMNDIAELVRFTHGIRAICVITWNANKIRPWVTMMNPDILGDGSDWNELSPDLDPIVVAALEDLTLTINLNNTITAGYDKDDVVSALLALRAARIPMDAEVMQGWALSHGWSGENPEQLAKYVRDINAGKRPRTGRPVSTDYVEYLRQRLASGSDLDTER